MFNKTAHTDKNILFRFPIPDSEIVEAISYIEANGIEDFIASSNIEYYAPNLLPLNKKTLERLSNKPALETYDDITRYIESSSSIWSNPAAETTQNQYIASRRLGYKIDHYGSKFLQGDIGALAGDAISFPLMEEEMFLVCDIINEKGIRFFVGHCAPAGLPECPYVKDTKEETIANFESLNKWYGPYWLLGQLNDAAILNIKEPRNR